jgi:hypothetical protein
MVKRANEVPDRLLNQAVADFGDDLGKLVDRYAAERTISTLEVIGVLTIAITSLARED